MGPPRNIRFPGKQWHQVYNATSIEGVNVAQYLSAPPVCKTGAVVTDSPTAAAGQLQCRCGVGHIYVPVSSCHWPAVLAIPLNVCLPLACCVWVGFGAKRDDGKDYLVPFPLMFDRTAASCMPAPEMASGSRS